jgi:hypothetical protein
LLALEDDLEYEKNRMLRMGIQLIVDGTDPDYVSDLLKNKIYTSGYIGRKLLEQFIIHDGVLSIQCGDNPRITKLKLISYLGDRADTIEDEADKKNIEDYRAFKRKLEQDTSAGIKGDIIDEIIAKLDDRDIQKVLRETDTSILALAVCGMSGNTKMRIYKNMSQGAGIILNEQIAGIEPVYEKSILDAQENIRSLCRKLEDQGEIVFMKNGNSSG